MKRKKTNKPDGRCATCKKWDRWHIRLPNYEDQQKVINLYRKSGAKTKSDYLRARLLGDSFKVVTEDKSNEKYLRELSNIISQIYKIGVLYNELSRCSTVITQQPLHRECSRNSKPIQKLSSNCKCKR